MRRHLGHPHPVTLASVRSGTTLGVRRRRLSAHIARCPQCAQIRADLDAIAAALATAPLTPPPPATEKRIMSALAAEARARRARPAHPGAVSVPLVPAPRSSPPPEAVAAPRGPALEAVRRRRTGFAFLLLPVAACTRLLGLGLSYVLSGGLTATSGTPAGVPLIGPPQLTRADSASQAGPPTAGGTPSRPAPSGQSTFLVTDTNTRYRKSTLGIQVRSRLAAQEVLPGQEPPATGSSPTTAVGDPGSQPATASTPGGGQTPEVTPSKALVACVMHLTRDESPMFVDRATYQAVPVYVIAVSNEAWVVGIDCTATRPAVIASVTLGSPG